jgi:uncharacterized membrane protein YdjX (TVP38/TMEM64 family)
MGPDTVGNLRQCPRQQRIAAGATRGMSFASRSIRPASGRLLVAGAICGLAVIGILGGRIWPGGIVAVTQGIVEALRGTGIIGAALFTALQIVIALSGAVPASLLGVAAGAIYGLSLGFTLASIGCLLGAVIAFGLSRSMLRPAIERFLSRRGRLRILDAALAAEGWKLVCLLRLSPVMPFSATSYLIGLSTISLPHYLAGTLASLPALFGYVLLGTLTESGLSAWASGANPLQWIMLGVGGIATLLAVAQLGRLVSRQQLQMADRDAATTCPSGREIAAGWGLTHGLAGPDPASGT